MANSAQARKRIRQSASRRQRNSGQRAKYRTYVKKVESAIIEGDSEQANNALKSVIPVLDKMVTKGILHKNTVARYKSRLTAKVRALA